MSGVVPYNAVHLNENSVPGALLPHPDVRANKVLDLSRFLAVRGVRHSGKKKEELVKLVQECIDAKTPVASTADAGKWLQKAVTNSRAQSLNENEQSLRLDVFPVDGWRSFPSRDIPSGFSYESTLYTTT